MKLDGDCCLQPLDEDLGLFQTNTNRLAELASITGLPNSVEI